MSGDPGGLEVFEVDSDNPQVSAERSLFFAAFGVAVRRRFGVPADRREIIEFIAELRVDLSQDVEDLDPQVTEDWIRGALGDLPPERRDRLHEDPEALVQATIYVLARLRNQGIVGDGGMDRFLDATLALAARSQDAYLEERADERGQPPMPPVEVIFGR
ncbi:hypothetical protein ACFQ07_29515 [Actinomadura adrarensis]|uniref:DUF2267 domain-containing protein n=1 Tax=Actinomadura adrarensis TaxID=1819600 RepID=A0ABW3CPE0_9ACTN